MKKTVLQFVSISIIATVLLAIISCGSMSNMSYEDSYRLGYDIGRTIRESIDR